jgi:two-component system chemotaxis response regulator CheY
MSHILLVEDNPDMQKLLCEMLVFGDHTVLTGRTGQEALDVLQDAQTLPELIISDLNMPRLDGIGLLDAVRNNPNWKDVAFVIMSANVNDERLTPDVIASLDGIIPKPFNLDDLNGLLSRV